MITLSLNHWDLSKRIGSDNYAQGIRKMANIAERMAEINLDNVAKILGVGNSYESIATQLMQLFPALETGVKRISHLMAELMLGEASLAIDKTEQTIFRIVNIIELKVFSENCPGKVIKESKQVWHKTGKVVERNIFVSEKIGTNVNIETEIKRALLEELSLPASQIERFEIIKDDLVLNTNSAYKVIDSYSKIKTIEVWVNNVSPSDIYIEKQAEKDTFFEWVDC
jgi:hypothetical protein